MLKLERAPYLIQLFSIKNVKERCKGKRLSETLSAEYMGSAEFEFGAIPKAYREIALNFDSFRISEVESIKDKGRKLQVWHAFSDEDFEKYVQYLLEFRGLLKPKISTRTKELVRFEYISDIEVKGRPWLTKNNFWWDIRNQVMWSFEKTFMDQLNERLQCSIAYMITLIIPNYYL